MDKFQGNQTMHREGAAQTQARMVTGHPYGADPISIEEAQQMAAKQAAYATFGEQQNSIGNRMQAFQTASQAPHTVRELISSAHEALSLLQQYVNGLGEMLVPVLSAAPPDSGADSVEGMGEPDCIEKLMSLIERIQATTNRVSSISSRVRV